MFGEGVTSTLFLLGLVMVVAAVLFRAQWRGRRRGSAEPAPWPAPPVRSGRPREAEDWRVELHDLARETSARLDGKMAALEQLIRDARRESARLETLLDETAQRSPPPQAEEYRPRNQAEALAAARAKLDRPTGSTRPAVASPPRRHDDVYALADAGLPAPAIAERLGAPVGEVELILGLRGSR